MCACVGKGGGSVWRGRDVGLKLLKSTMSPELLLMLVEMVDNIA